jgi:hypothetical protein
MQFKNDLKCQNLFRNCTSCFQLKEFGKMRNCMHNESGECMHNESGECLPTRMNHLETSRKEKVTFQIFFYIL